MAKQPLPEVGDLYLTIVWTTMVSQTLDARPGGCMTESAKEEAGARHPPRGSDERAQTARVRKMAERYWERLLALEPLFATEVGEDRYDHLLPDRSLAGLGGREEVHRQAVADLREIDRTGVGREDRIVLDLIETCGTKERAAIEHRFDRFDSADHMWGPGTMLAQIASVQRADTQERLERYILRLRALPRFLAAASETIKDAARSGQTSPKLVVDRTIAQVERLLRIAPAASPAISPVPEADVGGRVRVAETLRDAVYPAYEAYLHELQVHRSAARQSLGLGALRNGESMYAAKILAWTTLPQTARDIHERGAAELARIQEERHQLAATVGAPNPEAAVARLWEKGADAFESRESMLRLAESQVERGWAAAREFFERLPAENCIVRPVDPSREDDVLEHYVPGTPDGTRPATYYVNTKDPKHRRRHSLATTTYHEANPGHHLQIAIEQEATDRSAIRRFGGSDLIGIGSAFVEGGGLYAERLADEMNLYEDVYERMGMLEMQAFRAARLLVDTGIHAFGWDRERAIDTMASTGIDRATCALEVDRYVAMPGQALCYTLGQLTIQDSRSDASKHQAGSFSLRAFHERLLSLGSVPLPTLQREMASIDG
jgi:uncharacterized protein (DUF885 family)